MKLEITDVIHHQNKYGIQVMVLLNRHPDFKYVNHDGMLLADDSGFFNAYRFERSTPYCKAFAGRNFLIPMKDGTNTRATGQWWSTTHPGYNLIDMVSVGYATIESLDKCHVFTSGLVSRYKIEAWLENNKPTNNINRYRKNHKDYDIHTIVSKWETT